MEIKAENLKSDPRIASAVLIALEKARLYKTLLAVRKDGQLIQLTPDEFEKSLPIVR